MTDPAAGEPPWDDPSWRVARDSSWQAGLRWQQCWWRAEHLALPAGPFSKAQPNRLVGSTLALDAPPDANFLTDEAAAAAARRLAGGGGGLVKEDRLRRFLLSSQPMLQPVRAFPGRVPSGRPRWMGSAPRQRDRPCNPRRGRVGAAGGGAFPRWLSFRRVHRVPPPRRQPRVPCRRVQVPRGPRPL